MQLTPREFDKLIIHMMAEVALKRKAKGIKLNYPEAVAIISANALDGARAGKSIEEVTKDARTRPHQGRRDGRRGRPDSDGAGRGGVHRRQPPRDRPHADPVSNATRGSLPWQESKPGPVIAADVDPATEKVARGRLCVPSRADRLPRQAQGDDAQGAQHRRPPGSGRFALSFLRSQSRRWNSTGPRRSASTSTFRRPRRCASSPATSAR